MFAYLYEWMKSTACYFVLITVLMQIVPNTEYRKYIRFFTGVLLAVLLLKPIVSMVGMNDSLLGLYQGKNYEAELSKIEEAGAYLEEIGKLRGNESGAAEDKAKDILSGMEEQGGEVKDGAAKETGEAETEASGEAGEDQIRIGEIRIGQ